MGQLSHNFEFLNPLTFNPSDLAAEWLGVQSKMLTSAVELMIIPFEANATQTKPDLIAMPLSKVKTSIAAILTAKLADPALSFTSAVETAEPLFDILSDEDV
jgi:hypothetical protein